MNLDEYVKLLNEHLNKKYNEHCKENNVSPYHSMSHYLSWTDQQWEQKLKMKLINDHAYMLKIDRENVALTGRVEAWKEAFQELSKSTEKEKINNA